MMKMQRHISDVFGGKFCWHFDGNCQKVHLVTVPWVCYGKNMPIIVLVQLFENPDVEYY